MENWLEDQYNNSELILNEIREGELQKKEREILNSSKNLNKKSVEKKNNEKKLLKKREKSVIIQTKIISINKTRLGSLCFTANGFKKSEENHCPIIFFLSDIEPYNKWKIGDLIEIDFKKLNWEKFSLGDLKYTDEEAVRLTKKVRFVKKSTKSKKKKNILPEKNVFVSLENQKKRKEKKDRIINRLKSTIFKLQKENEEIKKELKREKEKNNKLLKEYNLIAETYYREVERKNTFILSLKEIVKSTRKGD